MNLFIAATTHRPRRPESASSQSLWREREKENEYKGMLDKIRETQMAGGLVHMWSSGEMGLHFLVRLGRS